MAGVSHFQRYSQRENHVTNNTLLVMRHLYQTAPQKLESVLRDLLGEDKITLGPTFTQQIRGSHSVPDALIAQAPFRLYVETKLTEALDLGQLRRHIESLAKEKAKADAETILLGLSTARMPAQDEAALAAHAKDKGVTFKSVSFANLVEALDGACADYEAALRAIIADYVDFLGAEGLLYASADWMLVVPCGTSYAENERFGVYYDGADRPKRSPCKFLGVYKDKRVSLVGEIRAVAICRYRDGQVVVQAAERGALTPDMTSRIRDVIEATRYYDLTSADHRFYVVDHFEPTDLIKATKGPIRGAQYLQLSPIIGKGFAGDAAELAQRLRGQAFPAAGA